MCVPKVVPARLKTRAMAKRIAAMIASMLPPEGMTTVKQ
jgi:hypothetical protein